MVIAVDFDGTCVTHEFPKVGKDIGAVPVLKELVKKGHKIILYTMRSHPDDNNHGKTLNNEVITNDPLQDAIDWFKENNIPLYGVNENPSQKNWTSSPKVYADIYIDDSAYGAPLVAYNSNFYPYRPYINWEVIRINFKNIGII